MPKKQATATADKAYKEARATAWKAYEEGIATAKKAYEEAIAPAWKAYKEARATARKAYAEATKMLCPLFEMTYQLRRKGTAPDDAECLEVECAWYRQSPKACAVQDLAAGLEELTGILDAIWADRKR